MAHDAPHDPSHDHGRDHGHAHGHGHGPGGGHPAPTDFGAAFAIGVVINAGFTAAEAAYGVLAHSVALLADAGHNLADVTGLLLAWGAATLVKRPPRGRFTYGLRSSSILAALFNALLLLGAVVAIGVEALHRLARPEPVAAGVVMAVAAAGVGVNGVTAALFASGRRGDLNVRSAFLHMAADALLSLGVVVAGLAVALTGWLWLDPLTSLALVAVVAAGAWSLLRESVALSLHAAPAGMEPEAVDAFLRGRPGVSDVHHVHVWPLSTTEAAMTAHLVIPGGHPGDAGLADLAHALRRRFGIGHVTLQVETDPHRACVLEAAHGM